MERPACSKPDVISYKTEVVSTRSVVSWEIGNFGLVCPRVGGSELNFCEIYSPYHVTNLKYCRSSGSGSEAGAESDLELKWSLGLSTSKGSYIEDYLKAHLYLVKTESMPEFRINLTTSVIGSKNSVIHTQSAELTSSALQLGNHGYPAPLKFIKLENIWESGSKYLSNVGTLHLRLDLTLSVKSQPRKIFKMATGTGFDLPAVCMSNHLCQKMDDLLRSGQDSDITLTCRDGKILKAHSYILKVQSPVFRAMFKGGKKEPLNSVVKIDDVDPVGFEAFLEYLYKGTLPAAILENLDVDALIGLVRVADKYQVLKLRDFCFSQLAEQISLERAGEIVVLMGRHSAPERIRSKCVGFCLENWRVLSNDAKFKRNLAINLDAFLNVQSSLFREDPQAADGKITSKIGRVLSNIDKYLSNEIELLKL